MLGKEVARDLAKENGQKEDGQETFHSRPEQSRVECSAAARPRPGSPRRLLRTDPRLRRLPRSIPRFHRLPRPTEMKQTQVDHTGPKL